MMVASLLQTNNYSTIFVFVDLLAGDVCCASLASPWWLIVVCVILNLQRAVDANLCPSLVLYEEMARLCSTKESKCAEPCHILELLVRAPSNDNVATSSTSAPSLANANNY